MAQLIGIMAIVLALSSQASAAIGDVTRTTCTAAFGEEYGWLQVEIVEREVCLRCTEGETQVLTHAKVAVPYGPRGTFITQHYYHTTTQHFRLSESHFKKSGEPTGAFSEKWADWFPEDMSILSGTTNPLYLHFKGESLDLNCK